MRASGACDQREPAVSSTGSRDQQPGPGVQGRCSRGSRSTRPASARTTTRTPSRRRSCVAGDQGALGLAVWFPWRHEVQSEPGERDRRALHGRALRRVPHQPVEHPARSPSPRTKLELIVGVGLWPRPALPERFSYGVRTDATSLPTFPDSRWSRPEGLVKLVGVATNVRGALEVVDGRQVVISRSARVGRAGEFLQVAVRRADGRLDLWGAWESHRDAVREARRKGQTIPAFPTKFLPSEVHRRRAGQRPNTATWTMPDLAPIVPDQPPISADPDADKRPGRSKKDA
jgi:hypothetical protein